MQSTSVSREDENDSEVRREDQDNINRFARLNARLHQVRQEKKLLQKELESLDDASTELMMMNGDVLLMLGEAFLETPEDEATEYCEAAVERLQSKMDALTGEEEDILQQQQKLKVILYGRFGKSINLEDDEEDERSD